ncbi:MAG: GTPase HflX, partial [Pseudomonadota bacterium]
MGTAFVLHPVLLRHSDQGSNPDLRSAEGALEEAVGLVAAIGLSVTQAHAIAITRPRPATLFGTGKLDEIKAEIDAD